MILLIPILAFIAYISVTYSIPMNGDGAFHAGTVEKLAETGKVSNYHPYTLESKGKHLPIYYPKLFYVEMAALRNFMGPSVYSTIVPLMGAIIGLITYLLSREIFKNQYIGIVSMLVVLCSSGLIANSAVMFRMENMVILLLLASIYTLFIFTKNEKYTWFICSVLLLSAAVGTKQISYAVLPIYIMLLALNFHAQIIRRIKYLLILFCCSFLIASPVLINEFVGSGTLFYPGVPFVGNIEKAMSATLHINLDRLGNGWKKYAIGSDRSSNLKNKYHDLDNHLAFLNPFTYFGNNPLTFFSALFICFGLVMLFKQGYYFLFAFMVLHELMLAVFPLTRYFLINQIFASI
jgi:hypothetical protein